MMLGFGKLSPFTARQGQHGAHPYEKTYSSSDN